MQVAEDILYVDLDNAIIPVSISDILYIDFGSSKCIIHLKNGTVLYEQKTRSQTAQALIQRNIPSMFVCGLEGFLLDNVIWEYFESGVPFWWSGNATFPVHLRNDSGDPYISYLSKRSMENLIHQAERILNKQIPYLKEFLQVFRRRISLNDLTVIDFNYSSCDTTDRDNNHYPISYSDACGIISCWNQVKIIPEEYAVQTVVNLNVIDWESTMNLGFDYTRDDEEIFWMIDKQKNRLAQYITKESADAADILSGERLSKEFCCAHSNYCAQVGDEIKFSYQNQNFWSIWGKSSLSEWESETGMRKPLADKPTYLLNPDMIDWEKCRVCNDITTPVLGSLGYRRTLYFKDGEALSVSPEEYAAQAAAAAIPENGISKDTVYDENLKISFPVSNNLLAYFPNISNPVDLIMLKHGYIGQVPTSWEWGSFEEEKFVSGLNKFGCKLHKIQVLKIDSGEKCKSVPAYLNLNVIDLDDKHWFSSVRITKPGNMDTISKKLENVYRLVNRDGKVIPDIWIPGEEWEKLKEAENENCR